MTVTAEMIAELRRYADEPTTDTYSDDTLKTIIEKYPVTDERGIEPYYWTETSTIPVKTFNTSWIPTYNLNMAASDIWVEKTAAIAHRFDFSADGGSYTRSQEYNHAMAMSKFFRSRGSIRSITLVKTPNETRNSKRPWIGNLPEDKEDY